MKTPEDYINKIILNEANLDHIAKTGKINGTLYVSLKELFLQAQLDAIDFVAENAEWSENSRAEIILKHEILLLKRLLVSSTD